MAAPREQAWANSGADCCSPLDQCLLAWCLPCITYGRTHHRLHKDSSLQGWSMFNMDCLGYTALGCCGLQWVIQMMQRGEIRKRYGLKGNGCTDCLCACYCLPCDVMQQDKEVESREQEKAHFVNQQPGPMGNMQYGA